jgi:hypothetical protein
VKVLAISEGDGRFDSTPPHQIYVQVVYQNGKSLLLWEREPRFPQAAM